MIEHSEVIVGVLDGADAAPELAWNSASRMPARSRLWESGRIFAPLRIEVLI
jgi:hypothetical protein